MANHPSRTPFSIPPTSIITLLFFLFLSLHSHSAFSSSDPLSSPPSPAPLSGADSPSTIASPPTTNPPESPSPVSSASSPPSPPPYNAPSPASPSQPPSQSPETDSGRSSPASAPAPVTDEKGMVEDEHVQAEGSGGGGGLNGGKKAGIAVGVLIGACAVGVAGFVYKKRQDNIRRSQYGYAARSSMI